MIVQKFICLGPPGSDTCNFQVILRPDSDAPQVQEDARNHLNENNDHEITVRFAFIPDDPQE